MKKDNWIFKNLSLVIILVLIGIILLQRSCTPDSITDNPDFITITKKKYELLLHKKDTFYVTEHIYYKGDPIPGKETIIKVPVDVDTSFILQDYFTKRPYSETVQIKTDSTSYGTVTVKETIFKNRLFNRTYDFNINIPTYTETIVVKELPKRQIYVGAGINFDQVNLLNSAYGGILYKTRKDHIYGINLGISTNFEQVTPFIGGSVYWKIKLKKDKPKYGQMGVQAAQIILDNL